MVNVTAGVMREWMCVGVALLMLGALAGCGEASFEDDASDDVSELSGELTSLQRAWASGTFEGDLGIRASWGGSADLDLFVKTPNGKIISYKAKTDGLGGTLTKNACTASSCRGQTSEEVAWLNAAPTGRYEIWVQRDNSNTAQNVTIEVSRAGAIEQTFSIDDLATARGSRSESVFIDVAELPVESKFNGELGLQLSWSGAADLDLYVTSPTGEQIYFGRRQDALGGTLSKNVCLLTQCKHAASEEVTWDQTSPRGTFKVRVVNYNGSTASNVKLRVHNRRQIIQTLDVTVPARRSSSVNLPDVVFDSTPLNPDGLSFVSHENNDWIKGSSNVPIAVAVEDDSIQNVSLSINGRDVGMRAAEELVEFTHTFAQLGEQSVDVLGFDGDGMVVSLKQLKLIVTDAKGGLPRRGTGARDVSRAQLARRIEALNGLTLYPALFDTRYLRDERNGRYADAKNNMLDAMNNNASKNSCYGNAPCKSALLDEQMLQAIVMMNQLHGYSLRITTITGGSHSARSRHYDGIAFDIDRINGTATTINSRTLNKKFTDLCRTYGATEILAPPDAGHDTHIHCGWPR